MLVLRICHSCRIMLGFSIFFGLHCFGRRLRNVLQMTPESSLKVIQKPLKNRPQNGPDSELLCNLCGGGCRQPFWDDFRTDFGSLWATFGDHTASRTTSVSKAKIEWEKSQRDEARAGPGRPAPARPAPIGVVALTKQPTTWSPGLQDPGPETRDQRPQG